MNRRFRALFALELRYQIGRPLFWVLVVLIALCSWGLSTGGLRISSGASQVGGTKAWITSQFAVAQLFAMLTPLLYGFFIAVAAGMGVIQDEESKIEPLLHSTPLKPWEYVWGKFTAALAAYAIGLILHAGFAILFNHLLPAGSSAEIRGPLELANYAIPILLFSLPILIFVGGFSFAIGSLTRRPILVFFLPTALLLGCVFFLWEWSPTWLDPRINQVLMLVEPAGFRWLNETWLKVDRGVDFYNHSAVPFDLTFLANRLLFAGIGLGTVLFTQSRLTRSIRGADGARLRRKRAVLEEPNVDTRSRTASSVAPLGALSTVIRPPAFLRGSLTIARSEANALARQPGLYLFVPLILLQVLGNEYFAVGAFDTPLLVTSGTIAAQTFNTLALLLSFLILFYTVESLERERHSGMSALFDSATVRTSSILFGKALANAIVGAAILGAALLGALLILLIQGRVPLDLSPFALVWGLLLLPTLLLWSSFVTALHAWTRNRYTTYALGLAALAGTGLLNFRDKMTWAGNWNLWRAVRWTDIGPFELDRTALLLNRLAALSLTVFFVALTVRVHPRREADSGRTFDRLRPLSLLDSAFRLSPWAIVPLVLISILGFMVAGGREGEAAKKREKDYWAKNLATWKDAPLPEIANVDLDVELEPQKGAVRVRGFYDLVNHLESPLRKFPLTTGPWKELKWTVNGQPATPEDRKLLWVFTPERPLAKGETVKIGFSYEAPLPAGISKNGRGMDQFVLPSSVVLTSFEPTWVPVLGYVESIGIDEKENKYDAKEWPDDFYTGITPPESGWGARFSTRIRVTAPRDYTVNSVGVLESTKEQDGKKTVVWVSDQPVRFFNVVAGRWKVSEGNGTKIFYHPDHAWNIGEMQAALDASRKRYSEWFRPYPWKELKLSEFAQHAFYAQGFPTNITFSEGIGFKTKSDPKAPAAFMVTAHEAAHQWWGNMLVPGRGPGGEILVEGMSHYSTLLLIESEKGASDRMELAKRFEERYAKERQVDSERPLVKIDGSRKGDKVVIYEKGGWVFWMLQQVMGREAALAGLRDFLDTYVEGPDYPVLQDYVAVMRRHAPDPAVFDAFVSDWFFAVVMPEYRITNAKRVKSGNEWLVTATVENAGTGRLPLVVATARGERVPDPDAKTKAASYQDARTTVSLGAKEKAVVTIHSAFEPDRILVDPDVQVLQLERNKAIVRF